MIPPRPELVALGIPYRRVPVLAVGNDVYCDSALITDVLERRFPPSQGYPSLYPPRIGSENGRADTGLAKVLTTYWANNIVGKMIAFSLDFGKFPPELLADRSKVCTLLVNLCGPAWLISYVQCGSSLVWSWM